VTWMNKQFIKHDASKVIPSEQLALESVSNSVKEKLSSAAIAEVKEESSKSWRSCNNSLDELEEEIEEELKSAQTSVQRNRLPDGRILLGN